LPEVDPVRLAIWSFRPRGQVFQVAARDRRLAAAIAADAHRRLASRGARNAALYQTPWAVLRTVRGHRNTSRRTTQLTAIARQIVRSVQAGSVWPCFCTGENYAVLARIQAEF
jgi:hypothetical protein